MKHSHHQIVALVVQNLLRDSVLLTEVFRWEFMLDEVWDLLDDGELREAGPDLVVGRAQVGEDQVQHFELAGGHEERLEFADFEEDAADRPHVDGDRVLGHAEEQLGRPVPNGHDLVGEGTHGHRERPGEAEIRQLELLVPLADEDVLGLQVSVHDAVDVAGVNGLQNLLQVRLHELGVVRRLGRVLFPALHLLREVALTVLEDEQDLVELRDHVSQLDQVRVVELPQLLERRDFAQKLRGDALGSILRVVGDLERVLFAGLLIDSLVDLPISTLTDLHKLYTIIEAGKRHIFLILLLHFYLSFNF